MFRKLGLLALVFALTPSLAFAQLQTGSILVKAVDDQGSTVPGATVTLTSSVLPAPLAGVTDSTGVYRYPSLAVGVYSLKVSLQGFQTVNQANIIVTQSQTASVELAMKLSSIAEEITVKAESPVVDSKRVSVAVRGDTAPEPDEQFFLRLSAASNASIADGEGTGTIQNDDLSPHAPCTITGTNRADVLHGTAGDDVICAGNGDDRLYGGGGRDVLIGGNGDDRLEGGEGSDLLLGQNGKDELRGDAGNDTLWGGQGKDSLEGGTGSDALFGGGAPDSCLFDPADFVVSCP